MGIVAVRRDKELLVREIEARLESAKVAILTEYRGLDVQSITRLRRRLKEIGTDYRVVKNTLTRLAADGVGMSQLGRHLYGPIAIAFGQDPVATAKVLVDFSGENGALKIKAGFLDQRELAREQTRALANISSREELLASLVQNMAGSLTGLASVLCGIIEALAHVLDSIREQKEVHG